MVIKKSQVLPFDGFCIMNYWIFFTCTGNSEVHCDVFIREVLSVLMFNFLLQLGKISTQLGKLSWPFVFVKLQCDSEFLKKIQIDSLYLCSQQRFFFFFQEPLFSMTNSFQQGQWIWQGNLFQEVKWKKVNIQHFKEGIILQLLAIRIV